MASTPVATRDFDPELIEHVLETDVDTVDIYKLGGGTPGRAYEGFWGYRLRRTSDGRTVASGGDLHTGTPKTHAEAAKLVVEICGASIYD